MSPAEGTGEVDSVTVDAQAIVSVTGEEATGQVGSTTVVIGITVVLTGEEATGSLNSVTVVGEANIPDRNRGHRICWRSFSGYQQQYRCYGHWPDGVTRNRCCTCVGRCSSYFRRHPQWTRFSNCHGIGKCAGYWYSRNRPSWVCLGME